MIKKIVLIFCAVIFSASLMAAARTTTTPIVTYQTSQMKEIQTSTYGGGLMLNHMWTKDEASFDSRLFTVNLSYNLDQLKSNALFDKDKMFFHQLSLQGMYHAGNHDLILIASARGNEPFSSREGLSVGACYEYALLNNQNWTINIGGGLFVMPIKLGSVTLPVIPLPIFQASYKNDVVTASLIFMGVPSVSLTLFNQSPVRFSAGMQLAGLTSINDLSGHASLRYYVLPDHPVLKILNLQLGVEKTAKGYLIKNDDKTNMFGAQNWGVYGALDASIITVKAGYLFDGVQKINYKEVGKTGQGWYCTIQGMFFLM